MRSEKTLTHMFVEFIPDDLDEGWLYISLEYGSAAHRCCCGCGTKVVTPITPTDWKLIFDGETVSLHPSIGNWGAPCRSHYWVRNSRIVWAGWCSIEEIVDARARDQRARDRYFGASAGVCPGAAEEISGRRRSLWGRLVRLCTWRR